VPNEDATYNNDYRFDDLFLYETNKKTGKISKLPIVENKSSFIGGRSQKEFIIEGGRRIILEQQ
jgi:hypothetical protein